MTARIRPAPKWQRILTGFMAGQTWHALTAGPGLRTTCLNSDIPLLEARGLKFDHIPTTIPGFDGVSTRVMAYRLRPESYGLARRLLGLPESTPEAAGLSEAGRAYLKASRG